MLESMEVVEVIGDWFVNLKCVLEIWSLSVKWFYDFFVNLIKMIFYEIN